MLIAASDDGNWRRATIAQLDLLKPRVGHGADAVDLDIAECTVPCGPMRLTMQKWGYTMIALLAVRTLRLQISYVPEK